MKRPVKRFFHSLFFRLSMIFILVFALLVLGVGSIMRVSRPDHPMHFFRANLMAYVGYLADDIGVPPRIEKAQELSRTSGLGIVISGPQVKWESQPGLLRAAEQEPAHGPEIRLRPWLHHPRFFQVQRGEYRFGFTGRPWPMDEDAIHWQLFAVLFLIFLCLSLGFFLSRRLLFPLRKMRRSTEAFGEGKWDTRLPPFGTTEFDELRISLNGMAERIARQFRAMEELLLAVSHEIRSPLTRMRVAMEFIPQSKERDQVLEEVSHLDHLTGRLLERERIRRPGAVQRRDFDAKGFCENLLNSFGAESERLEFQCPGEGGTLNADEDRLALALRCLLENGLKYGTPGSKVSLRLVREGDRVVFRVQDQGPGISEDLIERVVEPFFQGDPSRKGSGFGLGLSLATSVAEAHGGHLRVSRRTDGVSGTCVELELGKGQPTGSA